MLSATMGCGAPYFSARTQATYQISPDGSKLISYDSTKEQQGLDLDLTEKDGKITGVKIHVDKASTAEAAIAASAQVTLKLTEILQTLIPLIEKAAAAGS
jgi:hypothetical protein